MSDRVTWGELREWCLEHGAKNDRIDRIEINGLAPDNFVVIITGHELNENERPFVGRRNEVAEWQSTQPLMRLP